MLSLALPVITSVFPKDASPLDSMGNPGQNMCLIRASRCVCFKMPHPPPQAPDCTGPQVVLKWGSGICSTRVLGECREEWGLHVKADVDVVILASHASLAPSLTGTEQYSKYTGYAESYKWAGSHRDETPR